MVSTRTTLCFSVSSIIMLSYSIVFGQKTFFDNSSGNDQMLKSEVSFHKSKVVEAIYYDRQGRNTIY